MAAAPRDDAGELRRADEASQSDVCEHRRAHVEPHYVASQSSTSCSEHHRAHVDRAALRSLPKAAHLATRTVFATMLPLTVTIRPPVLCGGIAHVCAATVRSCIMPTRNRLSDHKSDCSSDRSSDRSSDSAAAELVVWS